MRVVGSGGTVDELDYLAQQTRSREAKFSLPNNLLRDTYQAVTMFPMDRRDAPMLRQTNCLRVPCEP